MLEKPDVPDLTLSGCLRDDFGVCTREVTFLPLGNDVDTAAYRVVTEDGTLFFLKLRGWRRSGQFDQTTVAIPRFLHDAGIAQVIAPIPTRDGRLWALLGDYAAILFPFVSGQDGIETPLSARQWISLGAALRAMHTLTVPPPISCQVPRETYDSHWRDFVRAIQRQIAVMDYTDVIAAATASFLRAQRAAIDHIISRAESLAATLRANPPATVLCHADIHAANVLLAPDGALHIVDWDTLIIAPKERDLMFIGGGIGGVWNTEREAALFYRGYGQIELNATALAYYRYERIIEDIAAYSEELLLMTAGGADRARGLDMFRDQFSSGDVVDIACRTDRMLDRN
jgi:spectinomycin phosphotransferase